MRPENEEHIYRLSTIDQSLYRQYIRFCVCLPTPHTAGVVDKLVKACQKVVTHLPILGGTVRPCSDSGRPEGRLEVAVTLNSVGSFAPKIRHFTFQELQLDEEHFPQSRSPVELYCSTQLTPMPDSPDPSGAPAFVVQGNIIRGAGVLLVLYLHHSVGDIRSLGQIMRHMSSELPSKKLLDQDLRADAAEQSKLRDRLSGSRGVKPEMPHHPDHDEVAIEQMRSASQLTGNEVGERRIIAFNLDTIEETRDMVNNRLRYLSKEASVPLTTLDCLSAILWKGISRACWPNGPLGEDYGRKQHLTIPVDIRKHMVDEPVLPEDYFGNAIAHAHVYDTIIELGKPLDVGPIAHTARQIRTAIKNITEHVVRAKIGRINELNNISEAQVLNTKLDTDLEITSWAGLPLDQADFGLGIGTPLFGRKIGRGRSGYGCIVLPKQRTAGMNVWEVTVTLTEGTMGRLLEDAGFMRFVKYTA